MIGIKGIKSFPSGGAGRAIALTEEGRSGRELQRNTYSSLSKGPSSVNYGIAATGRYPRFNSLRDAPPLRRSPFPVGDG